VGKYWNDWEMSRRGRRHVAWVLGVGVLLVVIVVGAFVLRSTAATGDPGGKVINQLVPTASALPGHGTSALPWVSEIPQSLMASYVIKMEPFQDSCDGIAGTEGWSQVVVQAGFRWTKGLSALDSYMNPRLAKLGWSAVPQQRASNPPSQSWIKTLDTGSRAHVSVSQGMGTYSSHWQLDAIAKPVGKQAGGC
jgi:hypothetical protein